MFRFVFVSPQSASNIDVVVAVEKQKILAFVLGRGVGSSFESGGVGLALDLEAFRVRDSLGRVSSQKEKN